MSESKIEWTDYTWNPFQGCTRASAGCDNCYAMRNAHRFSGEGLYAEGLTRIRKGPKGSPGVIDWSGKTRILTHKLGELQRKTRPRLVFVNSTSDTFHHAFTDGQIAVLFEMMAATPQHTYQVLTKRAPRMARFFRDAGRRFRGLPNVWIGVSAEDQKAWDARVPFLEDCGAAVRFVSAEPMIGAIDMGEKPPVDWLIIGGESGPGARPFFLPSAIALRRQAEALGVPCFVKQLGADPLAWDSSDPDPGWHEEIWIELKDRKGGDMSEWDPRWGLSVREWPDGFERGDAG